jgi:glutamyl-tRNA reductase
MRERANDVFQTELERTLSHLKNLSPKEQKSIEKMGVSIVNKLLHNPILFLKENGSPEETRRKLAMVRKMFGIDPSQSEKEESE